MVDRNEDRQEVTLRDVYDAVGGVRQELKVDIQSVKDDMRDIRLTVNHHLAEFQQALAVKADRDELLYHVLTRYAASPFVRFGALAFLSLLGAATFGEPIGEVAELLKRFIR